MAQHYYSNTSLATSLSVAMGTGDVTIQVPESVTDNGWPTSFPFTLALDFGTVGVELVDVTSKGGLLSSVRTWNVTRAQDLTVASAHAASVPNSIRHVMTRRDLIEARQARSLQPDDAIQTYIQADTSNAQSWVNSVIGDLVIKGAGRVLIGSNVNSLAQFTIDPVDGAVQQGAPLTALAGFRRGNGQAFSTNYCSYSRVATWTLAANTWTDLGFDTNNALVADDGSMYTSPNFISRAAGLYIFHVIIGFPNTSGSIAVRWLTQGGTILAEAQSTAAANMQVISTMGMTNLPGAGYTIKAQAFSTAGGSMTTTSGGSPKSAFFAQVL